VATDRAAKAREAKARRYRESARSRRSGQTAESPAVDEKEDDEPPTRGRRSTRKSARESRGEQSTPPIQSIEQPKKDEEKDADSDASSTSSERRGPPRTPGDYHLCRALLATTYHRWIECRNCDKHFVQAEAYLTRIACPKCERHSKLYGYYWPKTDKEGKGDTEERVKDHRTIHRFIEPGMEREERKGRKGLAEIVREREMSGRLESEETEGSGSRTRELRGSPRRADGSGRRGLRYTM